MMNAGRPLALVTGGAGFFGIHAVRLLAEAGHHVLALGTSGFPPGVEEYLSRTPGRARFVACDISDERAVERTLAAQPVSLVIHAAVMTILGDDEVGVERRMTEVNALGTLNLLEAAREHGVGRFVYISSSGIYDSRGQGVTPVEETACVLPGSHGMYRTCKVYSEMVCQNFHEHGAFDVAIARIGSPYGPWERPTRSRKGMSLIYQLVDLALRGEEARIFGRGLTRDWTHMRDIARAAVLLGTCPREQLRHRTYNVTNGILTSFDRVLEAMSALVPGFSYRFVETESDANLIASIPKARGPLDITRLRKDTGFAPEFAIDEGLADYLDWAKQHGHHVMKIDRSQERANE